MSNISKFLASYISSHARTLFFIGLFFSITCLVFTRPLEIDGTLGGTFSEESSFYKVGKKIDAIFNKSKTVNLKIIPEASSLSEILKALRSLEDKINKEFNVKEVKSIATFEKYFYLEEIDTNASFESQVDKLKRIPFLKHLISNDSKSLLIQLKVGELAKGEKFDVVALEKLTATGAKISFGMSEFHIENDIAKYVELDLVIFITCILIISLFLTIYTFGSIRVILFTVFMLFVSLSPIVFLMNIFDVKINVVTILAFPVVLVLTIADMIHLLTGWQHSKSIEKVVSDYIVPSFLTSFAVMMDFLSLMGNNIHNIYEFSLIVSIAVILEFFIIFLYAPYLMPLLRIKDRPRESFLAKMVDKLLHYKKGISLFLIAGFSLGVFLIPHLKFNTTTESFFPRKSDLTAKHAQMNKDFNSLMSLDILVGPPNYPFIPGFKWDYSDIGKVAYTISDRMKKQTSVDAVYSVNEIVDYYYTKGMTTDKWESVDFENPLKIGNNYLIHSKVENADDVVGIYASMDNVIRELTNRATISFFSPVLLFFEIDQTLARQLLVSLLFSSLSIMFVFYLITRSIRNTFFALFANVMPIFFISILFYFLKLDLNLVTSLTAVICLGIVVDDTIHVLYRLCYRKEKNIAELGEGMITTTLILSLGFGSLLLSSFDPTRVLGLVSSVIFIIAVLSDLALLTFGVINEE